MKLKYTAVFLLLASSLASAGSANQEPLAEGNKVIIDSGGSLQIVDQAEASRNGAPQQVNPEPNTPPPQQPVQATAPIVPEASSARTPQPEMQQAQPPSTQQEPM